jgi:uncharacterized protein with FMN-binding domain
MKKALKFAGIFLIGVAVIAAAFLAVAYKTFSDAVAIPVEDVDFSRIADGEYFGRYETFLVKTSVKTTVKDGKITRIDVLDHFNGLGEKAEEVIDYIVEKQSLQVDSVSGATVSSVVIKKAVEVSLIGE